MLWEVVRAVRALVLGCVTAVAVTLATTPVASAQTPLVPYGLGSFDGTSSAATRVNDAGQVLGWTAWLESGSINIRSTLWTLSGGTLDLGTLGLPNSTAINRAGHLAGVRSNHSGQPDAFVWTPEAGIVQLELGGTQSIKANDINDADQVVGYLDWRCTGGPDIGPTECFSRAFFWSAMTGKIDLGTLGGSFAQAESINNAGHVVGGSTTADGSQRAFLWRPGASMIDLGTLGGRNSWAMAINDADTIVGWSEVPPYGEKHAFMWTSTTGMFDLGTLGGTYGTVAYDVNLAGQVVGYSSTTVNGFAHAFLWTAESGMVAIPDTTCLNGASAATSITSDGHIVGWVRCGVVGGTGAAAQAVSWRPRQRLAPLDYDADTRSDITVFRPGTNEWFVLQSSTGYTTGFSKTLGNPLAVPVPGDYDRDGKADLAVVSDGRWTVRQSLSNFTREMMVDWGNWMDVPVPADYDGDGATDIAVYRPGNGTWYILKSSENFWSFRAVGYQWGSSEDIPVPGDYDGDKKADLAVFRPSDGTWYVLQSSSNFTTAVGYQWGNGADRPVPGDYDGDGRIDIAVFRPSDGTWYILESSSNLTAAVGHQWGNADDTPMTGDYDGDGVTDIVVFRPSDGTWYILQSSTDFTAAVGYQWGNSMDIPLSRQPKPPR